MQIGNVILDELSEKIYLNKENAESILLEAIASDEKEYARNIKFKLIQVYGTGKYEILGEEPWDIPSFPDLERLKDFVSKEIQCADDVSDMLLALYHDFMDIDETIAKAVETALLAVECSEWWNFYDGDGREEAKIILFWLYVKGEFGHSDCDMITLPLLKDTHKAAELLRYNVVLYGDYNPEFFDRKSEGELDEVLEEAYLLYPDNGLIARYWADRCAVNGKIDTLVEIIRNADEEIKTADDIAFDLLCDWKYLFESKGQECPVEEIEKLLFAISEKGAYREFLLSLYQFGSATLSVNDGYEVVHPMLKNEEKAAMFAKKYGLELLDEPVKI